MKKLTAERARELLDYDPETGVLTWKTDGRMGAKRAGKAAGGHRNEGYWRVKVDGIVYQYHHVVWLIVHGEWPQPMLDHIDGDPGNNRITNLRVCTHSENLRNRRTQRRNKVGLKGVHMTRHKTFRAVIMAHGRMHWLGTFKTAEDAHAAYCEAARELHGEFANNGVGPCR